MRRTIPALAALLGLQAVAVIALHLPHGAAGAAAGRLVAADLKVADHLVIEGAHDAGTTTAPTKVELARKDGRWQLASRFGAPADEHKVQDLLDRLGRAERGLPIATSASSLARFKVADETFERRLVATGGGKTLATVYLGSAAGLRKSGARTADDHAVYAVDLALYDVPAADADWLDTALLHRDAASIASIELAEPGHPALTLERDAAAAPASAASGAAPAPGWTAKRLGAGQRLDAKQAQALVDAITNLKVDAVLGESTPAGWPSTPELELTLADGHGGRVSWALAKAGSGDEHWLKASDRPWYLQLKSWNAKPLLDAAAPDKLVVATSPPPHKPG